MQAREPEAKFRKKGTETALVGPVKKNPQSPEIPVEDHGNLMEPLS